MRSWPTRPSFPCGVHRSSSSREEGRGGDHAGGRGGAPAGPGRGAAVQARFGGPRARRRPARARPVRGLARGRPRGSRGPVAPVASALRRVAAAAPRRGHRDGPSGTVLHTFEVPDARAFRISTPILTAELDDPNGRGSRSPSAARSGRGPSSTASTTCTASPPQASTTGPRTRSVPGRCGGATSWCGRARQPSIQPGNDGRLTRTLGLSLQDTPPGEYTLTLTVTDEKSGQTVTRVEPFTVAP